MGRHIKDLTGKTFGRLTVIERAESPNRNVYWRCLCTCGNECIVAGHNLKNRHTTSCGCVGREIHTTHGMTGASTYRTWDGMIQRCENPNYKQHDDYGGRGIKVCERWHVFENFYADVSVLPHFGEPGYSLDRENNDGNYEPGNVRWATRKQQQNNLRNNVKVNYKGEEMTLMEAAEKSGLPHETLRGRYRRGDRGERLFRPVRPIQKASKNS